MEIRLPDPHPGRCHNYRHHWRDGSVRCLDYEDHDGACRFPQPQRRDLTGGAQTYTYTPEPPEPWVSPLDGEQ